MGVWLKVYFITKSIMPLRAQAHDILLNHDFHMCPQYESLALHELCHMVENIA